MTEIFFVENKIFGGIPEWAIIIISSGDGKTYVGVDLDHFFQTLSN